MRGVSLDEQETTINFYRDSDTAEVYTSDSTVMTRLDRKCREFPAVYRLVKQDEYGKWYELPKGRIGFKPPARVVTDAERENMRRNFERNSEKIMAARKGDTL